DQVRRIGREAFNRLAPFREGEPPCEPAGDGARTEPRPPRFTKGDSDQGPEADHPADPLPGDPMAAILFTSRRTGPPHGAVYPHDILNAQVDLIRALCAIEPGEIDLCTFPLFALFAPALGMTAIVPDMDPTRPALADPAKLVETIEDFGVTNLFGSPALLR